MKHSNLSDTFALFGCSHSFLTKKWMTLQLCGEMTAENFNYNWEIDYCLPTTCNKCKQKEEVFELG